MRDRTRWTVLGWFAVLGLWLSTAVYGATSTGLVGPDEPARGEDLTSYLRDYLSYRQDLFVYEQVANWALAAALLAIAVLAVGWLGAARALDGPTASLVASTLAAGAVIAAVTQVAYLGAEERVLAVADVRDFEPAPLATLIDAIGRTDDYVENLGYMLIAVAVTVLGSGTTSADRADRAWRVLCSALSVGLILIVVTSFAAVDANDVVLLALGAVLAPLWVLALARRIGNAPPEVPDEQPG